MFQDQDGVFEEDDRSFYAPNDGCMTFLRWLNQVNLRSLSLEYSHCVHLQLLALQISFKLCAVITWVAITCNLGSCRLHEASHFGHEWRSTENVSILSVCLNIEICFLRELQRQTSKQPSSVKGEDVKNNNKNLFSSEVNKEAQKLGVIFWSEVNPRKRVICFFGVMKRRSRKKVSKTFFRSDEFWEVDLEKVVFVSKRT